MKKEIKKFWKDNKWALIILLLFLLFLFWKFYYTHPVDVIPPVNDTDDTDGNDTVIDDDVPSDEEQVVDFDVGVSIPYHTTK